MSGIATPPPATLEPDKQPPPSPDTPKPKAPRGEAARKTLSAEAAAKATAAITAPDPTPTEGKETKPADAAAPEDEETPLQKAHYEKRMADLKAEVKAESEKLAAERKAFEESKKGRTMAEDKKPEAQAKFELPKIEMPDWDALKEDEDAVPHIKKAFNSLLSAFNALAEKVGGYDSDIDDLVGYATKMSEGRTKRFNKSLAAAIEGTVAKIKETYKIDELPEAVSHSFVKMYQAGLLDIDPHDDDATVAHVLKAWKLDNADLLEKHAGENPAEKAAEKKPVPAIRGASAGGGDGTPGLTKHDRIRAILLQNHPELANR